MESFDLFLNVLLSVFKCLFSVGSGRAGDARGGTVSMPQRTPDKERLVCFHFDMGSFEMFSLDIFSFGGGRGGTFPMPRKTPVKEGGGRLICFQLFLFDMLPVCFDLLRVCRRRDTGYGSHAANNT